MEEWPLFRQYDLVPPASLTLEKSRELAQFLQSRINPFARLVECRAASKGGTVCSEAVVLDVDVELSQRPAHDVQRQERLAVVFFAKEETHPEVFALRKDFPAVPHLNLRSRDFPASLCLDERPFDDAKLDWRVPTFLERIRDWLAQTAKGQLHGDDQPLEPLLFDPVEDLVLPDDVLIGGSGNAPEWLSITWVQREAGLSTAIARRLDMTTPQQEFNWVALVVSCPPQMHGVIRHMPRTLEELHDFMVLSDFDLLEYLRGAMADWIRGSRDEFERVLGARLILVVRLPKTRTYNREEFESVENRAFALTTTVKEVGADIGVWDLAQGEPGLLLQHDEARRGGTTSLIALNPRAAFTRSLAASMNGLEHPTRVSITAVGVGALGSQVVCNLVRAGFGEWTLIDNDVVLPHNLSRHSLYGFAVGFSKATALAEVLTGTIEGEQVALGIVADVLRPRKNAEQVRMALSNADVILDMSASISVARHLSHEPKGNGRRVSLFLNPPGTALTLLAEDRARRVSLDALEMQLYRAILTNPDLSGLLDAGGRLRMGQSCRDVSAQIPQDLVALHAALGSRAFRDALNSDGPQITTWRVEEQGLSVSSTSVDPAQLCKEVVGDWMVHTDSLLRERLSHLRQEKLPRETGGVLIGAYDMHRKFIYIVYAVPSPADSEEWPTAYIRGTGCLKRRVQNMSTATAGMLQYVGEWHSHPDGSRTAPSCDDRKVLHWLGEISESDGRPLVMAIVGDEGRVSFHLGDMTTTTHE